MPDDSQTVRDANEVCCCLPVEPTSALAVDVMRDLGFENGYRLRAAVTKLKEMGISIASRRDRGILSLAIAQESKADARFTGERYWREMYRE